MITTDDPVTVAELSALGAALGGLDAARASAAAGLEPRHFRHPDGQAIYAAAAQLAAAGAEITPAAVIAALGAAGKLREGMAALVRELPGHAAADPAAAARQVLDAWHLRQMRGALSEASGLAEGTDAAEAAARIRALIDAATVPPGTAQLPGPRELLDTVFDQMQDGTDPAIPTGLPELDEACGIRRRQVVIIAGRPGSGKSVLGAGIADHVATELELDVLYSSLEMDAGMLTMRRVSRAAGVPFGRLVRHQLTERDWELARQAYPVLSSAALHIDDTRRAGIPQIRARLAALERAGTPAAVHVMDYAQLAATTPAASREQEVAAFSREYRDLCGEFNVAGILLAQLNRGPEGRRGGRPEVRDLRESGALEADADAVWLLHPEPDGRPGTVDVIIGKSRFGPLTTVPLTFQGHYSRITSARAAQPPGPWSPSGLHVVK